MSSTASIQVVESLKELIAELQKYCNISSSAAAPTVDYFKLKTSGACGWRFAANVRMNRPVPTLSRAESESVPLKKRFVLKVVLIVHVRDNR